MIRVFRWLAVGLLLLGTGAALLVDTIWSVPMAFVFPDPRLFGTVLIGLGLIVAVPALRGIADVRRRTRRQILLPALVALSIGSLGWAYWTSSYVLEDVTFQNGPASLQGTLVLPEGEGPFPAVVFMHGSGPERRGVSFHFADRFARAGVAALIYDKRGTGGSQGGHPRDPYIDLAGDAVAAVRRLGEYPSIDADRIGLWGLSEGGWTAPLAASMGSDNVAFLMVVSGGGAAPEDEELYSIRTHLEDRDVVTADIEKAISLRRRINDYYRIGEGRQTLLDAIDQVEASEWFVAAEWYLPSSTEVYLYGSEEWRSHMAFLDFDAMPLLRGLEIPMLFIHGELDRSYPSQLSVSRLNELTTDPSRDVSVITYAGADHAIMTRRVPWPRFADGYIEQMVAWVQDRFGG